MKRFQTTDMEGERSIYTPSAFAKQSLIYLQEIGKTKYLKPYTRQREEIPSFLFFIVEEGSGLLEYHDCTYNLKKGDCALIDCSKKYVLSSSNDLWELAWIHFNGPTMNSIYEKYIERCFSPCFTPKNRNEIQADYDRISKVSSENSYVKDMIIMNALSKLLSSVMEQCWENSVKVDNKKGNERWANLQTYILEHYRESISLESLAKMMHINTFYMERKYKQLYGITIDQYITNLRINTSKELLRFSNKTVTEIANECGYNDSAYFCRVFKKMEGVSPTTFKKSWKPS